MDDAEDDAQRPRGTAESRPVQAFTTALPAVTPSSPVPDWQHGAAWVDPIAWVALDGEVQMNPYGC